MQELFSNYLNDGAAMLDNLWSIGRKRRSCIWSYFINAMYTEWFETSMLSSNLDDELTG